MSRLATMGTDDIDDVGAVPLRPMLWCAGRDVVLVMLDGGLGPARGR